MAWAVHVALAVTPAWANVAWDRAANVRQAAERLAVLQRRQGADAVVKFLDACYRTHTLAAAFTQGLEACMAQDVMFSKVLVQVYGRIPAEELAKLKLPEPATIGRAMSGRLASVAQQYKLDRKAMGELAASIDAHGLPLYVKAVLPSTGEPPPQ